MLVSKTKGFLLNVLLADALKKLRINDVTFEIDKVEDWFTAGEVVHVVSNGFRPALDYLDDVLMGHLLRRYHFSLIYLADTEKLWSCTHTVKSKKRGAEPLTFSTKGRSPNEVVARMTAMLGLEADQLSKADLDQILARAPALDLEDFDDGD